MGWSTTQTKKKEYYFAREDSDLLLSLQPTNIESYAMIFFFNCFFMGKLWLYNGNEYEMI